ncbi:MAG TPA: SpoIIE family protein phosphatase [Bacteroidia bacterium]|jgi:serine phosphatase RsbU (regulator of sigma subunit)
MLNFVNTGFRKINIGFLVLVIIALSHAVISYIIINNNNRTVTRMTNEINPYVGALEQFNLLVTESKMYSTNWVYLQVSEEDKQALIKLLSKRYPAAKEDLSQRVNQLGKRSDQDSLKNIFKRFEDLVAFEQMIMLKLANFDDYENPKLKFQAEQIIEEDVLPMTDDIKKSLDRVISENRAEAEQMKNEVVASSNKLMTTVFGFSLGLFLAVVLAALFISTSIRRPVLEMKRIVQKLGRGEIPKEQLKVTPDVIGSMVSSVNALSENFEKTSGFADAIRKGNFSADFSLLSEQDQLGQALINMRNSLRTYSENMEEKVRERTREVIEKSEKLEEAYDEIRDSINYARRIQEAILPSRDLITKTFPQHFILYKSKDIVCGDFYWFAEQGNEVHIAAVDCTGHGVPGALMTVIGNSLLNQIVNIADMSSPADILHQLDKKLLQTLQQHGVGNTHDGMDVALCRYDKRKNEIAFSGAKRTLYLFRDGALKEVSGNKLPIGSFQYEFEKRFTDHLIPVKPNDTFYIFTDGYQDQFGGPNGKKFMVKQFRDELKRIQHMNMKDQGKYLDEIFEKWKGENQQTDDVLVIGIRF